METRLADERRNIACHVTAFECPPKERLRPCLPASHPRIGRETVLEEDELAAWLEDTADTRMASTTPGIVHKVKRCSQLYRRLRPARECVLRADRETRSAAAFGAVWSRRSSPFETVVSARQGRSWVVRAALDSRKDEAGRAERPTGERRRTCRGCKRDCVNDHRKRRMGTDGHRQDTH